MYKLNGTQIESAPQNTGNISGFPLYLANLPILDRQALGWFSIVIEDVNVTEPVIDAENDCIRIPTPIPVIPEKRIISISKIKLLRTLSSLGQAEYLIQYLNSDPNKLFMWNSAVTLDTNDPLVLEACELFKTQLGMTDDQLYSLFESCESDLV